VKATRDFFGEHLISLAELDSSIVVVNCDLGEATRTLDFKRKFPNRFIECGIAEANAISIASGLSKNGLKPFVTSFGHFLTGKFLEIFQSVGLNNSNVVLVGTHSGLAIGKDGPTQMGLRDVGLMRLLPNFSIYQPINEEQTHQSMNEIINKFGPKYLRLNRQSQDFFSYDEEFIFGNHSEIIIGEKLLVITQGAPTIEAYNAIKELHEKDSIGLTSIQSLPLNENNFIKSLENYQKILVVEDHYSSGGISDVVSRIIAENKLNILLKTLAVDDYGQAGSPEDLYKRYSLDKFGIQEKISKFYSS
jgi:transketolase